MQNLLNKIFNKILFHGIYSRVIKSESKICMKKIYQNSSIIKFDIFFEPISPTNNQSKRA